MSSESLGWRTPAMVAATILSLAAYPAVAQQLNSFPSDAVDDGKFFVLAGTNVATISQGVMSFELVAGPGDPDAVVACGSIAPTGLDPAGDCIQLGIFDGDTIGESANPRAAEFFGGTSFRHWDASGASGTRLGFAVFADRFQTGSTDAADLVGAWLGDFAANPTDGSPVWVSSSASLPDNGWWDLKIAVDPRAIAPSGAIGYHLCIFYNPAADLDPGAVDVSKVCKTGRDLAPPQSDPSPGTISAFKLRSTTDIVARSRALAFEGAKHNLADLTFLYPDWNGDLDPVPGFIDQPTTYDGIFSFELVLLEPASELVLFDGDFDFGTAPPPAGEIGVPSGLVLTGCDDDDDPDSPVHPAFVEPLVACSNDPGEIFCRCSATASGFCGSDASTGQTAVAQGLPADDSVFDLFRSLATPPDWPAGAGGPDCIVYRVISPGPDGNLLTEADNVNYVNPNPSSNREWERFRIATAGAPDPDDADYGPNVARDGATFVTEAVLPAGIWRVETFGVDSSNLNGWFGPRLGRVRCRPELGCGLPPAPFRIGDTVWADDNGNGLQDPDEAGISGVVLEVRDGLEAPLGTVATGVADDACRESNTGGNPFDAAWVAPVDEAGLYCFDVRIPNRDPDVVETRSFVVEVAAENFAPGGAIHELFGGPGTSTSGGPVLTRVLSEEGDNVLTFDFGFLPPPGVGTRGYWMNHPEAFPVPEISLGGVNYTRDEAIAILSRPVANDKTWSLASQLIAAKLNVLVGSAVWCIADTIAAADAWLAAHPPGSGVKARSDAWQNGGVLHDELDRYNNGLLCAFGRD